MTATLAAASATMPPAQRLENAPVLELVLLRVRLRARRRATWLAHLHGEPAERSDFPATPSLAACLDGRDAPDVEAACARFEQLGVAFQKRLTDGRMKNIAFIKDPDGYWVEILQPTARV